MTTLTSMTSMTTSPHPLRTVVCLLTLLTQLPACVTQPVPDVPTSTASLLGDRSALELDEIVISLPLRDAQPQAPYQNLHIALGIIINPVQPSLAPQYQVESLVGRLAPRISATVSAAAADLGTQNLAAAADLRRHILAVAQGVVDQAMHNWKYAADYKVEIVPLSIYWTDASVTRQRRTMPTRW